MNIRMPAVAGSFYEVSALSCRNHASRMLESARVPPGLPERLFGGLAPHAGWSYSGDLAALTFKALRDSREFETVVLFGADHRGVVRMGEVFNAGLWRTPLGDARVDAPLAADLLKACKSLRANPQAHADEHSIEVQVPIIQTVAPTAMIVPIGVPPTEEAVLIGRQVAEVLAAKYPHAMVVASTDLSHHGGHFGSPGGSGAVGEAWTRKNDARMLELVKQLDAEGVIVEAADHGNACGAGAVAAAVAACRGLGAAKGIVLRYTNSYEVMHRLYPDEPDDTTVGYASVVFA